jgi:hypothetical protein
LQAYLYQSGCKQKDKGVKKMMFLSKKNGKLYIEAKLSEIPSVGTVVRVPPDLGWHVGDGTTYEFRITGLGVPFERKVEECVVDEDYCHDGQRPVGRRIEKVRRAYGAIVGTHKAEIIRNTDSQVVD